VKQRDGPGAVDEERPSPGGGRSEPV